MNDEATQMNDDELDAMLRAIPTPEAPRAQVPPKRLPVAELVVFSVLALVLLGWAFGVLSHVFGV